MIVDSSAVMAIFLREPEAERIEQVLQNADVLHMSAATLLEVFIALSHRKGQHMQPFVETWMRMLNIELIAFTEEHLSAAMNAWWRYGRSRSVAKLNFGDCIAYATAALANEPLLCKGEDFPLTDATLVPW